MRRHFIFVSLLINLLLVNQLAVAQTYPHTALWLRVAPTYALDKHWTLLADAYYRRQSHHDSRLGNLLDSPLLVAGRVGIAYRTAHWQYSLYPASHFYTYPLLGLATDQKRAPSPEWRPTVMAEWTLDLPRKSALRLRGSYEYRLFTTPGLPDLGRMRFRALYRQGLGQRAYTQIWNETLAFAPPNVPVTGNLFDVNRTNVALGYALSNRSTVEMGYQYSHRQRRSLVEFDDEQAVTMTIYLRLKP